MIPDDDTIFGYSSSSDDEIDEMEYFNNTHFNCIPVLAMEWNEQQYQYDENGIISSEWKVPLTIQCCMTRDDNDELSEKEREIIIII